MGKHSLLGLVIGANHMYRALRSPERHLALAATSVLAFDHLVNDFLFVDHDDIRHLLLIVNDVDLEVDPLSVRCLDGMSGRCSLALLLCARVKALRGRCVRLEGGAGPLPADVDPLLAARLEQLLEADSLDHSLAALLLLLRLRCTSVPPQLPAQLLYLIGNDGLEHGAHGGARVDGVHACLVLAFLGHAGLGGQGAWVVGLLLRARRTVVIACLILQKLSCARLLLGAGSDEHDASLGLCREASQVDRA